MASSLHSESLLPTQTWASGIGTQIAHSLSLGLRNRSPKSPTAHLSDSGIGHPDRPQPISRYLILPLPQNIEIIISEEAGELNTNLRTFAVSGVVHLDRPQPISRTPGSQSPSIAHSPSLGLRDLGVRRSPTAHLSDSGNSSSRDFPKT